MVPTELNRCGIKEYSYDIQLLPVVKDYLLQDGGKTLTHPAPEDNENCKLAVFKCKKKKVVPLIEW